MGQPQTRGLQRQRDIAALFDKGTAAGTRPYGGAPLLKWPWKGTWVARVPGHAPAQPGDVRTVVLYNRLDVKDATCGPVPIVVKISAVKNRKSCTDQREIVVGKVIRRLVARGALVNAAVPLFVTGAPNADSSQTNIQHVLLGPAGELPPVIAAALKKANMPATGVVLVSFAAVRNCPPPTANPPADPFGAFHASMRSVFPEPGKTESVFRLLATLEAALVPGCSPTLRAHASVLLRSVLAQLALAYGTVNQAGVQHLDGHFDNMLVAPTAPFDITAETAPGVFVTVPVRGCLVQVFDWDWSVKWMMPVNDQVLNIKSIGDTGRCMTTPPGASGFVFDNQRRIGNVDWARVLLLLAGGFPRCFALAADSGVAQRAFGTAATTAARSSGISVTHRPNRGRYPYEHGFLAIGAVDESRPCTDHAQVHPALVALPRLCKPPFEWDAPANTKHAVRLPFALSEGRGERQLFDSAPDTPKCPLFPSAEQTRASVAARTPAKKPRQTPAKKPRQTPTKKPRQTPTKKPRQTPKSQTMVQKLRGWFTRS